jgi:hypothetical protein
MTTTEQAPAVKRPRKSRVNLTLDPEAQRLAEEIRKEDHRASLVNTLEALVFQEAKRRGLPTKD